MNLPTEKDGAATIVWYRQDLRTADHPALSVAASLGRVVPVFIWSPAEEAPWAPGGAAKVWLAESLRSLATELEGLGSRLIIRRGPAAAALKQLVRETRAVRVFSSKRYEPQAKAIDADVRQSLAELNVELVEFPGATLFQPGTIVTQSDKPFQVYTPFSKACLAQPAIEEPLDPPEELSRLDAGLASLTIEQLDLKPRIPWDAGIRAAWQPGAPRAMDRLRSFLDRAVADYDQARDLPGIDGTSQLSPHLHWGELSMRQVWQRVHDLGESRKLKRAAGIDTYVKELLWREFAYHLLFHFPATDRNPLRGEFQNFPWRENPSRLKAWQRGETGYPLVDAGMRQLWRTGWMHNRVRMVVASFLVKHLLIPWQSGAEWFWDTLVDADLANNTLGWQWTAGCGADAAPFFRIFNPASQGKKFDTQGDYVRQWVPELARLPEAWIHTPADAPAEVLREAGVVLGQNYPRPIVDHAEARALALDAFKTLQSRRRE